MAVDPQDKTTILDVGCACGGLGLALSERFGCSAYTGLEIHSEAARRGAKLVERFGGQVFQGDILEAREILTRVGAPLSFDLVTSLGALDWNTDVPDNVRAAWDFVKEGGQLLMSVRLHPEVCLMDIRHSRQFSEPEGTNGQEFAPYVVMAVPQAVSFAQSLGPESVEVFGYWGTPTSNAQTSLSKCIFAVALLKKPSGPVAETNFVVHSPDSLADQVQKLLAK